MNNDLRVAYTNLSKKQKICLLFFFQVIIIIIIVSILHVFLQPKNHIVVQDDDNWANSNIPQKNIDIFEKTLWDLISSHNNSANESIIDDVVIRDGSYSEIEQDDSMSANFIIDIDSIKQTYVVSIGWPKNKNNDDITYNDVVIDCPPQNQMKYPETVCYGMYNNTYSLDLYLPWQIDSPYQDEYEYAGSEVQIDGDESAHTITVSLAPCNNMEENKQKANDYLQTIPNINDYQVEYVLQNGVDIICAEDL